VREGLAAAAIDALTASIAILDRDGVIVGVNAAWQAFARSAHCSDPQSFLGVNYLSVCDRAAQDHCSEAAAAADRIRRCIAGEVEQSEFEYSCDSPTERRWFLGRATRTSGTGELCVVAHVNITRKRAGEIRSPRTSTTRQ
jgi:PAS domain-containing protein